MWSTRFWAAYVVLYVPCPFLLTLHIPHFHILTNPLLLIELLANSSPSSDNSNSSRFLTRKPSWARNPKRRKKGRSHDVNFRRRVGLWLMILWFNWVIYHWQFIGTMSFLSPLPFPFFPFPSAFALPMTLFLRSPITSLILKMVHAGHSRTDSFPILSQ